jgi:hypothetical protein
MSRLFSRFSLGPDMILGPLFPDTMRFLPHARHIILKPFFFLIKYIEVTLFYMCQIIKDLKKCMRVDSIEHFVPRDIKGIVTVHDFTFQKNWLSIHLALCM